MAKQVGPLFFTGTIDGLIFYKLGDKYYTRSKGSYKSAQHMRRNPKYKRTMEKADQFGNASSLLKEVYYRYLPKTVRKHGLYGKLTGLVNTWLQQGKNKKEVKELLIAHCQQLAATATTISPKESAETSTRPEKRSPANGQRITLTTQRSTNIVQCPSKQSRYLSHWKVKRNGQLHIPRRAKSYQWLRTFEKGEAKKPVVIDTASSPGHLFSNT